MSFSLGTCRADRGGHVCRRRPPPKHPPPLHTEFPLFCPQYQHWKGIQKKDSVLRDANSSLANEDLWIWPAVVSRLRAANPSGDRTLLKRCWGICHAQPPEHSLTLSQKEIANRLGALLMRKFISQAQRSSRLEKVFVRQSSKILMSSRDHVLLPLPRGTLQAGGERHA